MKKIFIIFILFFKFSTINAQNLINTNVPFLLYDNYEYYYFNTDSTIFYVNCFGDKAELCKYMCGNASYKFIDGYIILENLKQKESNVLCIRFSRNQSTDNNFTVKFHAINREKLTIYSLDSNSVILDSCHLYDFETRNIQKNNSDLTLIISLKLLNGLKTFDFEIDSLLRDYNFIDIISYPPVDKCPLNTLTFQYKELENNCVEFSGPISSSYEKKNSTRKRALRKQLPIWKWNEIPENYYGPRMNKFTFERNPVIYFY